MTDLKKSTGMRCPECCATDSAGCTKADCAAKHPGYVLPGRLSDEQIDAIWRNLPMPNSLEDIRRSFARACIEAATASPSAAPIHGLGEYNAKLMAHVLHTNEPIQKAATLPAADAEALAAARDRRYPIPDSPHASVLNQAHCNRAAYEFGWADRAADAAQPQQVKGWTRLTDADDEFVSLMCDWRHAELGDAARKAFDDVYAFVKRAAAPPAPQQAEAGALPPMPAPTRMHYGLHYRAQDMEAYARAAIALAQPDAAEVRKQGSKQ